MDVVGGYSYREEDGDEELSFAILSCGCTVPAPPYGLSGDQPCPLHEEERYTGKPKEPPPFAGSGI
jgi:hypothetical protein